MKTIKIFLASSSELVDDREAFELFVGRRNKMLVEENKFLKLVIWEDFLDAMARTRLQDMYNEAINDCDIFILLFYTKVGKYTEEEFDTAYDHFKENGKPLIFTYFKDVPSEKPLEESLGKFKEKLSSLGHFYTRYSNQESLLLHFREQLEKIDANADPNVLDTVRDEVSSGKAVGKILKKYREDLVKLSEDSSRTLTLLQGRAAKLEKDELMGVMTTENGRVERARITNALLSVLDDIQDEQ